MTDEEIEAIASRLAVECNGGDWGKDYAEQHKWHWRHIVKWCEKELAHASGPASKAPNTNNHCLDVGSGLVILSKYSSNVSIDHNVIYAGPENAKEVAPDDADELQRLGWAIDGHCNNWYRFS